MAEPSSGEQWIYFFGERSGRDIKIGITKEPDLRVYLQKINRDQTTTETYVILVGVRGMAACERALHQTFSDIRREDKGSRREYFDPEPELTEYVNWLRAQWFTTPDGTDPDFPPPAQPLEHWQPGNGRRIAPPPQDPYKLIADYDTVPSALAGTAWSWMTNPQASFQDYFTPAEIVAAASRAMGGIDLDAASHWAANRVHKIPTYYDTTRSAFANPWFGNVWLNPPYGDNAPWWREILRYTSTGAINQLCMLSPVWAFTPNIARPVMDITSAFVLLAPTPKFWGNANPNRTGSNQPHAIMYIGGHPDRFLREFSPFGLPFTISWDLIDAESTLESVAP